MNRALPSFHGGSFQITLTVPLSLNIFVRLICNLRKQDFKAITNWGGGDYKNCLSGSNYKLRNTALPPPQIWGYLYRVSRDETTFKISWGNYSSFHSTQLNHLSITYTGIYLYTFFIQRNNIIIQGYIYIHFSSRGII